MAFPAETNQRGDVTQRRRAAGRGEEKRIQGFRVPLFCPPLSAALRLCVKNSEVP